MLLVFFKSVLVYLYVVDESRVLYLEGVYPLLYALALSAHTLYVLFEYDAQDKVESGGNDDYQ